MFKRKKEPAYIPQSKQVFLDMFYDTKTNRVYKLLIDSSGVSLKLDGTLQARGFDECVAKIQEIEHKPGHKLFKSESEAKFYMNTKTKGKFL